MVLYSHAAVGGGIGNILGALRPDDDSRFLLLPPLSTGFGSLGTFAGLARYGVTLVVTSAFDPTGVIKLIERERVTHISIVGDAFAKPMIEALDEASAAGKPYDLSSLVVVVSSGVMWSAETKAELMKRYPVMCIDTLGSSEGVGFGSSISDPGHAGADRRAHQPDADDAGGAAHAVQAVERHGHVRRGRRMHRRGADRGQRDRRRPAKAASRGDR